MGMACPQRTQSFAIPTSDQVPLPAPCPSQLLQTLWGLALPPPPHSPPVAALWWGEGGSPPHAGAPGTHMGLDGESTHMGTEGIGDAGTVVRHSLRVRTGQVGELAFLAQTSVNKEVLVGTQ